MLDLPAIVSAYWEHHQLLTGNRASRLRAEAGELVWAWDLVEEAAAEGSADVLSLLDALLHAPEADPCYLGAGPVEELLLHHGPRFEADVAQRCRQSQSWRDALACVSLDETEAQQVRAVRSFLPVRRRGGR